MSREVMEVRDGAADYAMQAEQDVPQGHKRTEVGVIPSDWCTYRLSDHFTIFAGGDVPKSSYSQFQSDKYPYPIYANAIQNGGLYGFTSLKRGKPDSLTITARGYLGHAEYRSGPFFPIVRLLVLEPIGNLDARFTAYVINDRVNFANESTGVPQLTAPQVGNYVIGAPSTLAEQRAIATALSDVDALITALDRLIAKKRAIKTAAMQQLLTGKTRLPGFSGEWKVRRIAEIAVQISEKNIGHEKLRVLTCSKHYGFVDSLGYFKNQVFSKDTSGYKIIRRGQIGYPSNHIEEGSIGLQNLYDKALVSPIYVVFEVNQGINSYFLHRLLKLDSYRQLFSKATTASVDRRGSLKWPAFSNIVVKLPPYEEQTAIAQVLSDMDAEIAALEARRDKTIAIKQGMMQQLLTGWVRLVNPRNSWNEQ